MSEHAASPEHAGDESINAANKTCVWLLDIDGVVNCLPRANTEAAWPMFRSAEVTHSSGTRWPFTVAEAVIEFINTQHATGVEIRWATTWEDDANSSVAPAFGLPQLSVGARAAGTDDLWYKQRAALELVASGTPLVWTDDAEIDAETLIRISQYGTPALLISPDPRRGLTPEHLQAIAEFTARHCG